MLWHFVKSARQIRSLSTGSRPTPCPIDTQKCGFQPGHFRLQRHLLKAEELNAQKKTLQMFTTTTITANNNNDNKGKEWERVGLG